MRVRLALLASLLASPALAADGAYRGPSEPVDPTTRACKLLAAGDLARFGADASSVAETHKSARGITSCRWQGRDGLVVSVAHFPKGSDGVENVPPETIFEANIQATKNNIGQDYLRPLAGVGDRAYRSFLADNPTKAVQVYLLKAGDSATVSTFGLGDAEAEAIAKAVAGAM